MITGMVAGFEPIEVESALAATVTGSDGKTYLDCFAGIAVTNAGHNHPKVIAAAKAQMDKLVHCCTYVYYNPRAGELAKIIADITPGKLQKSFFGSGGAEAIEGALRIARQFTGKTEFVANMHSFHGRSNMTLSITGNRARKKNGGPFASGIAFTPAPYTYRCPFGSKNDEECAARTAEYLRNTLRYATSGDVAAYIAEPLMGEGGILSPHESYYKLVKNILDEEGILFIADEVQSGFGRTGKMFAIEHFGVEPDIMTMAKGIADGFPLSAFTVRSDIADAFKPGDHLSTFGGNPISCAAAIANIDVLQNEGLVKNSEVRGNQIMTRLKNFMDKNAIVGDIRGRGLMIGIELVKDKKSKTPASDAAKLVRKLCREAGVLIGIGGSFANVLRIQPPLCLTEEQAIEVCDKLEKAITEADK
jgi:4-aminobutyrate aminotransferase